MVIIIFLLFVVQTLNANIGIEGFNDYPNYYFVETGTCAGAGINKALETGHFKKIFSIDIFESSALIEFKEKNKNNGNIKIIIGDSSKDLWSIIKTLNKPITFWLDAHIYPGRNDGTKNTPILEELEQIKKHHIKTHTILIDDMACCGTLAFDYISKNDLIKKIKEINQDYIIKFINGGDASEVKDNILVAFIDPAKETK